MTQLLMRSLLLLCDTDSQHLTLDTLHYTAHSSYADI
jgi:hypothetical protein